MKSYKSCVAEDKACANSIMVNRMSTSDHDISHYIRIATVANLRKIFDTAVDIALALI